MGTRQLAADLGAAGAEHNARELGQIGASQLNPLLAKLAEFSPDQLADADPHLVVSGRRGRFLVRPARGQLRLFDASDAMRDPLEISASEVAGYLDGSELKTVEVLAEPSGSGLAAPNPRMGLVVALLGFSTAMVGGSAYFTFRPTAMDADVTYSPIGEPELLGSLRQQITGSFATGTGDGSRVLMLRADGTLTLIELGADNVVIDERTDRYHLEMRGGTPVARTSWLGPIDIRDAKTLVYAGESYRHQP